MKPSPGTEVDQGPPSFEEFYVSSFPRVAGAALSVVRTPEEARDIAQEAFLRTWMHWPRVSGRDIPILFTLRVARNLSLSAVRRARVLRRLTHLLPSPREPAPEPVDLPAGFLETIRALPDRQRWALVLTDYCDLPSEEAAAFLGISPSTLRVHLARARATLRGSAWSRDIEPSSDGAPLPSAPSHIGGHDG